MTPREKIITRLNKGFGYDIPIDTTWICRKRKYKAVGGFSWSLNCVEGLGCAETATEALKWPIWVIDPISGEIFEYFNTNKDRYKIRNYLIENGHCG